MKYIFFIHSNIASICAYDTIVNLLQKKEDVMVLLVRNTKWQFDFKHLKIEDISGISTLYYTKLPRIRSLHDIVLARFLKRKIRKVIHRLVDNDEYIMYIPQYHVGIVSFFCEDNLCKGYYYTEEGTLSYLSLDTIKSEMHYSPLYRFFSVVTGVPYHFAYHINKKFKGVVALSKESFPWYKGNKTINKFPSHYNGDVDYSKKRKVLILPPLTYGIEELIDILKYTVERLKSSSTIPIAIKFHPRAGKEEKDNLSKVMSLVKELDIEVLPESYVVEFNLIEGHSDIYSMQVKTSLLIYSVLAGRKAFFVHKKDEDIKIEELTEINNILE